MMTSPTYGSYFDTTDVILSRGLISTDSTVQYSTDNTVAAENTSDEGTDYKLIGLGLFASLVIVANAISFIFIIRTDVLKAKIKWLLGSLTTTDFLFGALVLLSRIFPEDHESNAVFCTVRLLGIFVTLYSSTFTVVLIALDRALAITSPIFYRNKTTGDHYACVTAIVWVCSGLFVTLSFVGEFEPHTTCDGFPAVPYRAWTTLAFVLLLCIVATFVIYCYIGWRLKKRMTQVGAGMIQNGIRMRSERRTSFTGLLLALVFLCGYSPLSVFILANTRLSDNNLEPETASRHREQFVIVTTFPLITTILDPIIYIWRIKEWHSVLFEKCRRLGRQKGSSQDANTTSTGTRTNTNARQRSSNNVNENPSARAEGRTVPARITPREDSRM